MKGLHELDAPYAFLFGITSLFHRLLVFLFCCSFTAVIGIGCAEVEETFEQVTQGRFLDVLGRALAVIIASPMSWLGLILVGLGENSFCILILPVLGVAFVLLVLTDVDFWHGAFLLLFGLPIQNVLAKGGGSFFSLVYLALYLGVLSWLYLLCIEANRELRS